MKFMILAAPETMLLSPEFVLVKLNAGMEKEAWNFMSE